MDISYAAKASGRPKNAERRFFTSAVWDAKRHPKPAAILSYSSGLELDWFFLILFHLFLLNSTFFTCLVISAEVVKFIFQFSQTTKFSSFS
jgi:hypothetical protein